MSAFNSNIVNVAITDVFGFGATLNADGSIAAITGPVIRRLAAAPTGALVDNAGSLVLRNNGSLYTTSGAGVWFPIGGTDGTVIPDNVALQWGTTAPADVTATYVSASRRLDFSSAANIDGLASPALRFETGTYTDTNAGAGVGSGALEIRTGATDVTGPGGISSTGSGALTISTGDSNSTAGNSSGNTGALLFRTGNSVDGNSGTLTLQTGTAGVTRGSVIFLAATIDYATQGVDNLIIDNTAAAWRVMEGANVYLSLNTQNGAETITIGQGPSAAGPNATVNFASVGAIITNGTDFGPRLCLVEEFHQKCSIAADLGAIGTAVVANLNLAIVGTGSTTALSTYAAGGGNTLTTSGVGNDQECMRPQAAGQSMWGGTTWSSSDSVRFKCNVQSPATITTMVAAAGLKLTVAAGAAMFDNATDANQAYFGFATDARYVGVPSANWMCVFRTGGGSANVDSGVLFSATTNYRLVIDIDAARLCRFYINGALVATTAAIGAGAALLPFAGVEGLVGARAITVQRMAISKLLV